MSSELKPSELKRWTPPLRIRAVAIAIVLYQDSILVFEGYDSTRQSDYYRPLGGEIEFGESGEQALHREFQEEIQQAICNVHYLETIENHYILHDQPGHELMRIYCADLLDPTAYTQSFEIREPGQIPQQAYFKSLEDLRHHPETLVPKGLWGILAKLKA